MGSKPSLSRLLDRGVRSGARRGLAGGSNPWLALMVLSAGARWLRRQMAKRDEVVLSESLAPGESILITHHLTTWGDEA
ncbi:MAG TPA: hypothetical protein VGA13_11270 [Acidimicrobiales bacterium]